jgi:N utilization substance protein A
VFLRRSKLGIKIDAETIKTISLFESITKAHVKDCFEFGERLTFIVGEGEAAKAVGKKGANVVKLERMLKRKLKIAEYSPDMLTFIRNFIYPLKATDISQEGEIVTITGPDTNTKGLLIGKNAANLRALEEVVRKFFDVEEIKVV